jgi:glutamate dehydrogenase
MMAQILVQSLPSLDSGRKLPGLTIQTTDLDQCSFPEYVDPLEAFASSDDTMMDLPISPNSTSRLMEKYKDGMENRLPSPQPTHIGHPALARVNGNGHRVLRSATVGYVAPEFKGRDEQIKQGMHHKPVELCPQSSRLAKLLTTVQ